MRAQNDRSQEMLQLFTPPLNTGGTTIAAGAAAAALQAIPASLDDPARVVSAIALNTTLTDAYFRFTSGANNAAVGDMYIEPNVNNYFGVPSGATHISVFSTVGGNIRLVPISA
jgi:hypothetical protein